MLPALEGAVVVQPFALVVAPQVSGVMIVGVALAVEAVKQVEPLLVWIALGAGTAQAPLADGGSGVALLLDQLGDGNALRGNGRLALRLDRAVVADKGVAGVLPGHQHAARGSTDGIAAVELREANAFLGHLVE